VAHDRILESPGRADDVSESRIIVEQFDPRRPSAGGVDTCIRGLVKYAPPGIRLSIAGVDAVGDARLRRWMTVDLDGTTIDFLPLTRLYAGDQSRRVPHSVRMASALGRARRLVSGADVIQTHRLELGAVVQRVHRRTPHVQFLHIDGVDSFQRGSDSIWRFAPMLYSRLEGRVLPRACDVVVFSSAGAARLASRGSHIRFSPTWFDPEVFYAPPPRTRPSGALRVLWVGRIEPPKDPLLAAEVAACLPVDSTVTFVGDGTMRSQLEEKLAELGVAGRCRVLGALSKREVADEMRGHDAVLMTSQYEGFPRAVVEGLACGLPVVTTPEGEPNGLVVDGRTGFHVPGRSPARLAERLTAAATLSSADCTASVEHLTSPRVVETVLAGPCRAATA
jgi:glycosyltransferase involved in cell wall biosynthesis